MKKLFLATLLTLSACSPLKKPAALPAQRSDPPPAEVKALPPDATHAELEAALKLVVPNPDDRSVMLKEMGAASRQIYAWQAVLNAARPPEHRLRFDREQKGIPIEKPFAYNADTVLKDYQAAIDALPPEMRSVITDPVAVPPASITTPDDEFEKKARKVLVAYDHAMRWEALSPYVDYYKTRSMMDVRAYHFLKKTDDLADKLTHWKSRAPEEAAQLTGWLTQLCTTAGGKADECAHELATQQDAGDVLAFYQAHVPYQRKLYDYYFSLAQARTDTTWYQEGDVSGPEVPFTKPAKEELAAHSKPIIEDAWKGAGWQLRVAYTDRADDDTTHMVFEAGALPHVNKIAGSEITMDENEPIASETVTATLQHEFGHVLGFPDCYVEFFDESAGMMINYQIDTGNIMCSRVGKVTDLHRDALRKAYERPADPRQPSSAKKKKKHGTAVSRRK